MFENEPTKVKQEKSSDKKITAASLHHDNEMH